MKRPLLRMYIGVFSAVFLMAAFFAVSLITSLSFSDYTLWQYISGWQRLQTGFIGAAAFGLLFGGARLTETFSLRGFGRGLLAALPITAFSAVCLSMLFINFRYFTIDNPAYFFADVFFVTIATSFFEETVLRGLVIEGYYLIKHQNRFTRLIFVFLSAALFAACHTQYYTAPLSMLRIFALGFSLAAIYLYSRNILVCTAVHCLYDISVCLLKYAENGSSPLRTVLHLPLDYIYIAMFAAGLVFVLLKKPYLPKKLPEPNIAAEDAE